MPSAHRIRLPSVRAGYLLLFLSAMPGLTAAPPRTLVEWKVQNFSADELRDGTSDDGRALGSDANPNLLRYALGFGPRESLPPLITIQPEGDRLEVITPQMVTRPDVTCQLEVSLDLKSWAPPEFDSADDAAAELATTTSLARMFHMDGPRYFRLTAERMIDDGDEDGLLDDRELAWFASVAHGPGDDPDNDGLATADELLLGRSPHRGVLTDPALAATTTGLEIFTPLE